MKYFAILMACLLWANHLSAQYTNREPAFLGIYSEQLSKEKARKLGFDNLYGSYVSRVVENSAAERAGVQPFDYIYGIDEYRTGKEQSLTQIIRKYHPNQNATLHLYRKGGNRTLNVTFSARSDSKAKARDKCNDPFFGISAAEMNEEEMEGVTVNIIDNSTAKAIGMENGDRIIAINGYRMLDWQDIKTAINTMKVGNQIAVDFIRNGKKMKKQGAIKSYSLAIDRSKLWAVMLAESEFDVLEHIAQMPLSNYMTPNISELMFHNAADSVMQFSLN